MPQSSVGFDLTPHDGVQSIRGGDVGHDREQYRADTEDKCALDFYSMSGGHDRPKSSMRWDGGSTAMTFSACRLTLSSISMNLFLDLRP